jgi:hypothetical protein
MFPILLALLLPTTLLAADDSVSTLRIVGDVNAWAPMQGERRLNALEFALTVGDPAGVRRVEAHVRWARVPLFGMIGTGGAMLTAGTLGLGLAGLLHAADYDPTTPIAPVSIGLVLGGAVVAGGGPRLYRRIWKPRALDPEHHWDFEQARDLVSFASPADPIL